MTPIVLCRHVLQRSRCPPNDVSSERSEGLPLFLKKRQESLKCVFSKIYQLPPRPSHHIGQNKPYMTI